MDRVKALLRTPPGLLGTVMLGTLGTVGIYKLAIRPELQRRSRAEANEFAEYLYRKEMGITDASNTVVEN